MTRRIVQLLVVAWLAWPLAALAQQQQQAPKVTVAIPLDDQVVDYALFTGRFAAVEEVTIQANVTGYLTEIHASDGQFVEAGDPLFTIDPRPFEAAAASARASLQSARAAARLAELDLERTRQLVADNVVAQQSLDSAQADYDSAVAAVAQAQANLRTAEINSDYAEIAAPVTGRLSYSRIDVGNLVTAGSSVLSTIVSVDPVHFVFDMSEADYLAYTEAFGRSLQDSGDEAVVPVAVRLLDETSFDREGLVDFVDNAFDTATGTIRIRALFANHDDALLPGLFGRLRIAMSEPYTALLIPDRAIMSDQANKMVMIVNAENKVETRTVELGPLWQGLRIITKGLEGGEKVIVDGLLTVRTGMEVTPETTTITLDGES